MDTGGDCFLKQVVDVYLLLGKQRQAKQKMRKQFQTRKMLCSMFHPCIPTPRLVIPNEAADVQWFSEGATSTFCWMSQVQAPCATVLMFFFTRPARFGVVRF